MYILLITITYKDEHQFKMFISYFFVYTLRSVQGTLQYPSLTLAASAIRDPLVINRVLGLTISFCVQNKSCVK